MEWVFDPIPKGIFPFYLRVGILVPFLVSGDHTFIKVEVKFLKYISSTMKKIHGL